MPALVNVATVYGGGLLFVLGLTKVLTDTFVPPKIDLAFVTILSFGALNVFQLGPSSWSSTWAWMMHIPDDVMWSFTNKRPFNFNVIIEPDGKAVGRILLGRQPTSKEDVAEIIAAGASSLVILNESWELCLSQSDLQAAGVTSSIQLPTPDFSAPTIDTIQAGVAFIESNINSGVYVHCNGGKGRSSVVVIAYLMKTNGWGLQKTYDFVKSKRKIANMKKFGGLMPQWRVLKAFEKVLATKSI